jgi:hypothetical protein
LSGEPNGCVVRIDIDPFSLRQQRAGEAIINARTRPLREPEKSSNPRNELQTPPCHLPLRLRPFGALNDNILSHLATTG